MEKNYPRPQLCRASWVDLNGEWTFRFDDKDEGETTGWYLNEMTDSLKIKVPFTYETEASGIHETKFHPVVWYQRNVEYVPSGKRVLLHFEGVDYQTRVWVNDKCVGEHTGGYARFSFDISQYLKNGDNRITVRVEDSISCFQPRGKQRWREENFACWYVQSTGIWKSVWMEEVPETYIKKIKITPDIDNAKVIFALTLDKKPLQPYTMSCCIKRDGCVVSMQTVQVQTEHIVLEQTVCRQEEPWQMDLWSPENPALYDVTFLLEEGVFRDEVVSYFGMRKIAIEGGKVLLNNLPLYQRLILDQGYWEESGLTPPSEEALLRDIDLILEAGYNGLRKHEKIEDERFLYWCDKKGLLVWCEMPSAYAFGDDMMQQVTTQWMEIVRQNYNHPCIITWTAFNESWGIERIYTDTEQQKFTESIYHLTKAFDPMRPVIVNDGWEHTVSDILTLHDYAETYEEITQRYKDKQKIVSNEIPFNGERYALAQGFSYRGQPVILSEYGGIAFTDRNGWGYGKQVETQEVFVERFENVMRAIREIDYFVGFCYTQLTDVQQEVNGLYTMKRKAKVNIDEIRMINL